MTAPTDDDPVTLKEACQIVFRDRISPATLRAEAAKGRLALRRIGRQDFVTLRDVRELVEICRAEKPRPAYTSTKSATPMSSVMERDSSAQVALQATLAELRRH